MITILSTLASLLSFRVRSRASLELELIALRHQVIVLRRQRPRRLRLFLTDRLFWMWLYRVRPQLLDTLVLVKPATVIGWHRKGFRIYWWRRSRRSGRSKTSTEIRSLIRRISAANPLWGAPRIHGELLKLGVDISQAALSHQISEAFPWDTAPRYLLRDRDASYGPVFRTRVKGMGVEEVVTAPRSPWQNPYAEKDHCLNPSRVS